MSLKFIRNAGRSQAGKRLVLCLCACGKTVVVQHSNLITGHTKSCGCARKGVNSTHGRSTSPEYRAWRAMIQRCTNPSQQSFPIYGGRENPVTICKRWMKFESFLADMGDKPEPKRLYSLDRFPNKDGNYTPSNCRWATHDEQANNRRARRTGFVRNGISTERLIRLYRSRTVSEISRIITGMTLAGILHRLKVAGVYRGRGQSQTV